MRLPESLRKQLKTPFGILLPNSQVNKSNIQKHISEKIFLITVGDATTENMINLGIVPSLQIIDNQEKRKERKSLSIKGVNATLSCKNPAGQITKESITAIKNSFNSKPPIRITVDGEEDLLVIPACIFAPANAIVMYGQPNEGLVIVKIDTEIRDKAQKILDSMI
ncbi:MAG: GTP-dependent dephospho-CoA kinase family protein [Nitrosopumilaceae archaeon]